MLSKYAAAVIFMLATNAAAEQGQSEFPPVSGPYLAARAKLIDLGFKPAESGWKERICRDDVLENCVVVHEAECAVDVGACNTYWKSRKGRALTIFLEGEHDPVIAGMEWISEDKFREFENQ